MSIYDVCIEINNAFEKDSILCTYINISKTMILPIHHILYVYKTMKKIITLIGLCLFLVGGNIFLSKVYAQSNPIGSLQVQFCNNNQITNEADLVAQAGKNMPICVELTNQASTPITINIQFSDSVITADGSNLRACNPPDRPLVQFGNFLLPYV
jgi:hypothetical protein